MTILDQTRRTDSGDVIYSLGGSIFTMPAVEAPDEVTQPVTQFAGLRSAADTIVTDVRRIMGDGDLSAEGKSRRVAPKVDEFVRIAVANAATLAGYEQHLDAQESQLLAPPDYATPFDAILDGEVRTWWRSVGVQDRGRIMQEMADGATHARIALALMRSPYAQLDLEAKVVREHWARARRLESPAAFDNIAAGRRMAAWARRGLGHIAGLSTTALRLERAAIVDRVAVIEHAERGAWLFGIDAAEIRNARRRLQQRAA